MRGYRLILPIDVNVSAPLAERYRVMVVDDGGCTVILARYLACESISVRRVPRLPIGIMDIRGEERRDARTRAYVASACNVPRLKARFCGRRDAAELPSGYLNLLIERYQ